LIVPFVLQITAVVGLVGYLSFKNGQQAVNVLDTQLMSEICDRIEQNLHAYLETPHKVNQSNAAAISLGQLKVQDLPALERHFWQQLRIFDTLTFVGLGLEQKDNLGAERFVVAKEVQWLADKATHSSQEIEEMVKEIQASVAKGVSEMDKFSQQVSHYIEIVSRISGQIASVIFQVQSLTPQFESVSDSMSGQFEGAVQISSAIAQLSEASVQTVESLQETNQALDQLNDTAQVLQGIISTNSRTRD
jgi:microcompartment protein CcmL/EutN